MACEQFGIDHRALKYSYYFIAENLMPQKAIVKTALIIVEPSEIYYLQSSSILAAAATSITAS